MLAFKMDITKTNEKQWNIIKDLEWHIEKAHKSLLYEIVENRRNVDISRSLNVLSSKAHKEYRSSNLRAKYFH